MPGGPLLDRVNSDTLGFEAPNAETGPAPQLVQIEISGKQLHSYRTVVTNHPTAYLGASRYVIDLNLGSRASWS